MSAPIPDPRGCRRRLVPAPPRCSLAAVLPVLHDALPKYKAAHPSASHQSAMAGVGAQWRQQQQHAAAGPGAGGASAAAEERTDSSPERETDGGGEVPGENAAESSADSSDDGSDSDSESVELTQAG